MLTIKILCVGKLKEAYFRDAAAEYEKRLKPYAKVQILEVSDERTKEHAKEGEVLAVKAAEGKRLLEKISEKDYVIGLFIEGNKLSSEEVAEKLRKLPVYGHSSLCFLIGGSLGLSEEVKNRCDEIISFSDLTFPHQLMRILLLEQIYRGFRINENAPYHK